MVLSLRILNDFTSETSQSPKKNYDLDSPRAGINLCTSLPHLHSKLLSFSEVRGLKKRLNHPTTFQVLELAFIGSPLRRSRWMLAPEIMVPLEENRLCVVFVQCVRMSLWCVRWWALDSIAGIVKMSMRFDDSTYTVYSTIYWKLHIESMTVWRSFRNNDDAFSECVWHCSLRITSAAAANS